MPGNISNTYSPKWWLFPGIYHCKKLAITNKNKSKINISLQNTEPGAVWKSSYRHVPHARITWNKSKKTLLIYDIPCYSELVGDNQRFSKGGLEKTYVDMGPISPFLACGFTWISNWFAKFMWTINNVNTTTAILPFFHGWISNFAQPRKKKNTKKNLTPLVFFSRPGTCESSSPKQPTLPLCSNTSSSTWIKQNIPTSPNKLFETNSTQLNAPQVVKPYRNPSFTKNFRYKKCRY